MYIYMCIYVHTHTHTHTHTHNTHTQYEERVDRVETQMTANLRNSLGAAKDAREMLSIFSVLQPQYRKQIESRYFSVPKVRHFST